jgi:AcrR family transcriptional regulator
LEAGVRRQTSDTKERILRAAHDLFYWQGIRATGVDRVALRAGVGPTQLYRLFGSKDDLVAAYTERSDSLARGWFDAAVLAAGGDPRAQILAVFDALGEQILPADFRGCACMMTLAEYPDSGSVAHDRAVAAKQWVRDRFRHLCGELAKAGATMDADALADDLTLVLEGVLASAQALGNGGPAARGRALAEKILDAAARADAAARSLRRGAFEFAQGRRSSPAIRPVPLVPAGTRRCRCGSGRR